MLIIYIYIYIYIYNLFIISRPIKKVRGQQKSTENPKWVAMKDQLVQFGHEAYKYVLQTFCSFIKIIV